MPTDQLMQHRPTTADSNTGCDRCGLRTDRTAAVIITGLAFMQNLRRGHHELDLDGHHALRVAAAFTTVAQAI